MPLSNLVENRLMLEKMAIEEKRSNDLINALSQVSSDLKQLLIAFSHIVPPTINVNSVAPVVNVTTPDVRVDVSPTPINVTVDSPVVNVDAPVVNIAPQDIKIDVSPTPVNVVVEKPIVNIEQPSKKTITVNRNDAGQIVSAEVK